MKKMSVMALALVAILSCKKEMVKENANTTTPSAHAFGGSNSLLDYEYYTPTGDLETEIRDALLALEDDDSLDYTDINRGLWLMETGLNYVMPDSLYDYDSILTISDTYVLSSNVDDQVSEVDIKSALINAHGVVSSVVNLTTKHVGSDFYITAINQGNIQVGVKHMFLAGSTSTLTQTGQPIGTTTIDRVAGYAYECPFMPGNGSNAPWREAKDNALLALRTYWGNSNTVPKFYSNVIRYSSLSRPYQTKSISDQHLLGNSAAYVQAHQSPVSAELCVTAAEQNLYAQAIYDDVNLITAKNKGVLELVVSRINNTIAGPPSYKVTTWHYRDVVVGINGFFAPTLPTLSVSYL